ncbi:hypothetical protein HZH68_008186 [Vespula germanica]|uniref:Uncharacterized protein n=1 Tax=Vespula germanica TaxID=30212 RepID=A0A834K3A1_VESGE|nr:hypothetical protein HZH68_008186 [Vespula germanica]
MKRFITASILIGTRGRVRRKRGLVESRETFRVGGEGSDGYGGVGSSSSSSDISSNSSGGGGGGGGCGCGSGS